MGRGKAASARWKWIALAVAIAAAGFLWHFLPLDDWLEAFKGWIKERGALGGVWFAVAYVLAVLLFIPGAIVTLAAGYTFGLALGVVVVSLASTAAAALAFLIARHLARLQVERLAKKSKKFKAFEAAIGEGNWKVVALMRLSPLLPFSASNYLFGLTPVEFWPYVLASWIAMLPGTVLYVYLGAAGGMAGRGGRRSPWEYALFAAGLLASAAVVVWMTRKARAELGSNKGKTSRSRKKQNDGNV